MSLFHNLTFCMKKCFKKTKCEGYHDHEIMEIIPDDYWLKSLKTRCLHACMVHRTNKEISAFVGQLSPGVTRDTQRENAAERVRVERVVARNNRRRNEYDDDSKAKKRIRNKIGEMSVIKSENEVVLSQLRVYNENKESFVRAMGEEAYDNKIMELLEKLPNPRVNDDEAVDDIAPNGDSE